MVCVFLPETAPPHEYYDVTLNDRRLRLQARAAEIPHAQIQATWALADESETGTRPHGCAQRLAKARILQFQQHANTGEVVHACASSTSNARVSNANTRRVLRQFLPTKQR